MAGDGLALYAVLVSDEDGGVELIEVHAESAESATELAMELIEDDQAKTAPGTVVGLSVEPAV